MKINFFLEFKLKNNENDFFAMIKISNSIDFK